MNKAPGSHCKLNMQKYRVQVNCPLLKPKIPKYWEPNERNAQGNTTTINFHSS